MNKETMAITLYLVAAFAYAAIMWIGVMVFMPWYIRRRERIGKPISRLVASMYTMAIVTSCILIGGWLLMQFAKALAIEVL